MKTRKRIIVLGASFFAWLAMISFAYCLPQGEQVVAGGGETQFERADNTLNVTTLSDKLIVNYSSFDIASNETVNFNQPSSSAIALNRVVGSTNPSSIFGALKANGQIFVVNPNGIFFGPNSKVDVAGLVASTLDITNEDFLDGDGVYNFFKTKENAYIINKGNIKIQNGGYVCLLSAAIDNQFSIQANLGTVVLASGEAMTLALDDMNDISVVVDKGVQTEVFGPNNEKILSAVKNSGTISANGGKVIITAKILNKVFDYAINNIGVIEAKNVVNHNGVIELTAEGAPIINIGKIEAGEVKISAPDTEVINRGEIISNGTEVNPNGGLVDISANTILQAGIVTADAFEGGRAGEVKLISTSSTVLDQNSTTSAAAAGTNIGSGGIVTVNSLAGNTFIYTGAVIDVSAGLVAGNAGNVEVSAFNKLCFYGSLYGRAPPGYTGATVLFDPYDIIIQNGYSGNVAHPTGSPQEDFNDHSSYYHESLYISPSALAALDVALIWLQATHDITVNDSINITRANTSLKLEAKNNININADITVTGSIYLIADADASGSGSLIFKDSPTPKLTVGSTGGHYLQGANSSFSLSASGSNFYINYGSGGSARNARLESGNYLYVSATNGDITVSTDISKSAGVELRAAGSITLNDDKDITASSGNIKLIADSNENGNGSLSFGSNVVLTVGSNYGHYLQGANSFNLNIGYLGKLVNGNYLYVRCTDFDNNITVSANISKSAGIELRAFNDIYINNDTAMTLSGPALFYTDENQGGSGRFVMNLGSSINAGSNDITIYASENSTLRAITATGGTLTLNESQAASNPTYLLNQAIDINNLTLNSGTLNANGKNINVSGNWTKASGANFNANNGKVIFDGAGTSIISGSTTFYNFECTTPGKHLTFQAGSTQTITRTLTLTGESGNKIVLRSSVDNSKWNIQINAAQTVSGVDVKDSDVVSDADSKTITTTDSVGVNCNAKWVFPAIGYDVGGSISGFSESVSLNLVVTSGGVQTLYTLSGITGPFTFSHVILAASDSILLFTETGIMANLVGIVQGAANISNLTIQAGRLAIGDTNANVGSSFSNANLANAYYSDSDVHYTVSGSNVTFTDGITLWIPSGMTYAPTGNIIASGSWLNEGAFTAGSNKVTFNAGTGTQTITNTGTGTFNIIEHSGAGILQPVSTIIISDRLILSNGRLSFSAGSFNVNTVNVNSPGRIQDGVNAVNAGGLVNAGTGTYNENLTINKALTLTAASIPVLDGTGIGGTGITITSNNVTIEKLTIQNYATGIDIAGAYTGININNNTFNNNTLYHVCSDHGFLGDALYNIYAANSNIFDEAGVIVDTPGHVAEVPSGSRVIWAKLEDALANLSEGNTLAGLGNLIYRYTSTPSRTLNLTLDINGIIDITNKGDVYIIGSGINSHNHPITINVIDPDLIIGAPINSGGADVYLSADGHIIHNSGGNIITNGGDYTGNAAILGGAGTYTINAGATINTHPTTGHDGNVKIIAGQSTWSGNNLSSVTGGGAITINSSSGVSAINPEQGTTYIVTGNGSILGNAYVETQGNVLLYAPNGTIGTISIPIDTKVMNLAARANGVINIHERTGLTIGTVGGIHGIESTAGNVHLTVGDNTGSTYNLTFEAPLILSAADGLVDIAVPYGAIYDNHTDTAEIAAYSVILSARNGIGTGSNPLDTAVNTLNAHVTGDGIMVISETDGINLLDVDTHDGLITITAGGAITATDVRSLTDDGANDISLTGTSIDVKYIAAGSGIHADVNLTAITGAITNSQTGVDVIADTLTATAITGIDLDTTINTLDASVTGEGNITIDETNAVTLSDVDTADGSITITAGGAVTASDVRSLADDDVNDISIQGTSVQAGYINAGATYGDVILTATTGAITENGDGSADVIADLLTATAVTGINLDTSINTLDATVTSTTTGNITIDEANDINLLDVDTVNGYITVNAHGLITATDVLAGDFGNNEHFDVTLDTTSGGMNLISVTADDDINADADNGSIQVGYITAGDDITLTADNGAITDNEEGTVDVVCDLLTATASSGIDLDTSINTLNASVTGEGNITIDEATGINLSDVDTADGSITITAAGAVTATDVRSLTDDDLNDIFIQGTSIDADYINAGTLGDVTLTATTGAITQDGDGSSDVIADLLTATAVTGIELDTSINTLDASVTGTGDIVIDETNDINLWDVDTANGDVTVFTPGSITGGNGGSATPNVKTNTLYLDAGGDIGKDVGGTDNTLYTDINNLYAYAGGDIGTITGDGSVIDPGISNNNPALNLIDIVANNVAIEDTGVLTVTNVNADIDVALKGGSVILYSVTTGRNILVTSISGNIQVNGNVISTGIYSLIIRPNGQGDTGDDLDDHPDHTYNYTLVDETSGDNGTYVFSGSADYIFDLYTLGDPSALGTISNVIVYIRARADNSNGRTPNRDSSYTVIRINGVDYYGVVQTLGDSYTNYSTSYAQNPGTLVAWTWDDLSALQAGVALRAPYYHSSHAHDSSRCTQVWAQVDSTVQGNITFNAAGAFNQAPSTLVKANNGNVNVEAASIGVADIQASADVSLIARSGDIVDNDLGVAGGTGAYPYQNDVDVTARNLTLSATGNIGGPSPAEIDLDLSGIINILSGNNIYLAFDEDVYLGTLTGTNINLNTANGGIYDGNDDYTDTPPEINNNITATNLILSARDGIGAIENPIETNIYMLTATTTGNNAGIYIDEANNLVINTVIAGPSEARGNVEITADGSITDIPGPGTIHAYTLTLDALSIGEENNPLDIDVEYLYAHAGGFINLYDIGSLTLVDVEGGLNEEADVNVYAEGDIYVDYVSDPLYVYLKSYHGSISGLETKGANVETDTLEMHADNGHIGYLTTDIDHLYAYAGGYIDLYDFGSLTLEEVISTSAPDWIYIESENDMYVNYVEDPLEVTLISKNGGILDGGDGIDGINIDTQDLILSAVTGIGSGNALETEVSGLTASNSTANSIEVDNEGNLVIKSVTNGNRLVDISSTGSITDDDALVSDITAGNLTLSAVGGINLDTTVLNLVAANSGSGDLDINNFGSLYASNVTNSAGDVYITVHSDLTVGSITGGNVYLVALDGSILDDFVLDPTDGNAVIGSIVSITANGNIGSFDPDNPNLKGDIDVDGSTVILNAGGNIYLEDLGGITSFGPITIGGLADILAHGSSALGSITVGDNFAFRTTAGDITILTPGIRANGSGIELTADNGSVIAAGSGPHIDVRGASSTSLISVPNGTIGYGNPVNVSITNGGLILDMGGSIGPSTSPFSGDLTGNISPTNMPVLFPISYPDPLRPPGQVWYNGIRIWPPTNNRQYLFSLYQSYSLLFSRFSWPELGQLLIYQVNTFDLMASNAAGGPVYHYHPLTETDMSAFDEFILEDGAYQFMEGGIGILGHDGLLPLLEEIKKRKKKQQ
ncbi:MAG: filamentous hemagglutinin N-terminal domain-containing protein [Candidatus Omnitrophica bacterium]|nr:filamentous hemagglutinin N-terminal domain-containing protein [Candidatus Omnitrophota bacterium]